MQGASAKSFYKRQDWFLLHEELLKLTFYQYCKNSLFIILIIIIQLCIMMRKSFDFSV